jgi:hypothetical protein
MTSKLVLRTVLPPLPVTSTVTVSGPGKAGAVYRTEGAVADERLPLDASHLNRRSAPEALIATMVVLGAT